MEEVIKLSKRELEQLVIEKFNSWRKLEDPYWVKEVDFRWCEYDDIDDTITLQGVLTHALGKKCPFRIDIELEKDLSEGFGEENNNYFVSLYEDKESDYEDKYDFKAELQEDFKEFLKNERRERSE